MSVRALALVSLTAAAAGLAVLGLARTAAAPAAVPAPSATLAFARSEIAGGGVYVLAPGPRLVGPGGIHPAWSPDARRLAYVAPGAGGAGDIYVVDADGRWKGRITQTLEDERQPDWSADGRRLVVEREGLIVAVRADGGRSRVLARGHEPDWSPDGRLVAFTRDGDLFTVEPGRGRVRRLTNTPFAESQPAWSPDSRRLVYVTDETGQTDLRIRSVRGGAGTVVTQDLAIEHSPAFSRDGRRILFVSDAGGVETIWTVPARGGTPTALELPALSADPQPRPAPPRPAELLPDLEQRAPADLSIRFERRGNRPHFLLGFDSATDNLGDGPITLVASRRSRRTSTMAVTQRVRLGSGRLRNYPEVGVLRYVYSPSHSHWHVMDFQRYELRRLADHRLIVRDRKSGFCLADHWAHAPGHQPNEPPRPVFMDYCERGNPSAMSVLQGTSVGYTDKYPSHFHGQNLDLTGVPAGNYLLVNRANPEVLIRELRYENNAASRRIRLSWPRGPRRMPRVQVLATCPDSERC
ncbi:MAG TPA: lysyl oxidase family protein [Gaiellaceae bacterium]